MIAIQWRTAYKIPKIEFDAAICAVASIEADGPFYR
jgi:hypothetical protein